MLREPAFAARGSADVRSRNLGRAFLRDLFFSIPAVSNRWILMWNLSGSGRDEEPQINHLQPRGGREEDRSFCPSIGSVLFLSRCSDNFLIWDCQEAPTYAVRT